MQLTISAVPAAPIDLFESVHLGRSGFLDFGSADYLADAGGSIEISELAGFPILTLNKRHASREVFDAACRVVGEVPSIIMESSSPHTCFP